MIISFLDDTWIKHIKNARIRQNWCFRRGCVNKTNLSKEFELCHYWFFKHICFKYEPYLCNGCHDLIQKANTFNNVAILYVKGSAYKIVFWYMSKNDAINIMNGSNLVDKRGFS